MTSTLTIETAANQLAELGHVTRLSIFRLLVKAGHQGLAVGDIQQALAIPNSTLSHHLSRLNKVGLMEQRREGRTLFCTLKFNQVETLLGFLYDECCVDMPGNTGCSTNERS